MRVSRYLDKNLGYFFHRRVVKANQQQEDTMEYKMDLVYKGIDVFVFTPKSKNECDAVDTNIKIKADGDVTVHIEGKYSWIESLLFVRMINKLIVTK
jgi:hypothetical protein